MINSEVNCNVLGNSGTGMPPDYKHSPLVKKIALRDVQNDNRSLIHSHPECSPDLERHIVRTIKVSGTKRLTPECPLSPPLDPSLYKNDVNDHLVHTRRKFESEPDKGRMQDSLDKLAYWPLSSSKHYFHKQEELTRQQSQMRESNLYCAPEVRRNHMASMMTFPYGGPEVSNSIGKHGNGQPTADSKATDDQLRKERYLHLQKFLKQCDEFIQRDYIQVLVNVSPAELSRHAIELEKRAIQLTVEEGSPFNEEVSCITSTSRWCSPLSHMHVGLTTRLDVRGKGTRWWYTTSYTKCFLLFDTDSIVSYFLFFHAACQDFDHFLF